MLSHSLCTLCLLILILSSFAENDDKENEDNSTVIILFMFFGLGLGIIVMQILSYFEEAVPYTCVVFIIGVIFSLANKHTGAFGESISEWVGIDAELVLFVFLPPLIFGEAMNLNWYHVKGGFVQTLILAGPGAVFGAVSMGVITKFLLPHNWNWNLAMTFGSILSATDPVAVISVLKSACTSPKLTILIVGESLLNDGTAMVLFSIFFGALNGTRFSVADIIAYLLSAVVGSVLLGVLFGLVTVRWLRSANRPLKESDVTMQTAMTICCAYLVFFTAQYSLRISGVLACVGAGVVLAWLAPPIILSRETMHNVWGMIEWVLNTVVFLLSGLIIGHRVIAQVDALDWLYCIVLYVVLMALRGITIALLYPWVSTLGHQCTRNEAIFMSCSGLRGALSMTLALIVENSGPKELQKETSRMFFFVGGIAALTLLINATTAKFLLVYLGLLGSDTAEKALVMSKIKKKLRKKMDKVVVQMAKEFSFTAEDLDEVRLSCTLLSESDTGDGSMYSERTEQDMDDLLHETGDTQQQYSAVPREEDEEEPARPFSTSPRHHTRRSSRTRSRAQSKAGGSFSTHATDHDKRSRSKSIGGVGSSRKRSQSVSHHQAQNIARLLSMSSRGLNPALIQELLKYVRVIFLEIVRVKYWHNIEGGKLPRLSHSAQFLLYSIEVGLDEVGSLMGARDWACIEEELNYTPVIVKALGAVEDFLPEWCSNWTSLTVGKIEARNEKRAVYMLTSFIEAHEHAQRKIHSFIDEDGDSTTDASSQTPEERQVLAESEAAVRKARARLESMSADTINAIRSKQTARLVLAREAELVRSMVGEGLLTPVHAEEFLEEIGSDTARIEKERNRMYREQAVHRGRMRQAMRKEEGEMRRSLLGAADELINVVASSSE